MKIASAAQIKPKQTIWAAVSGSPKTNGTGSGLIILDVSEVQDRVANPEFKEISRLTWESMSIPQNAIPITIKGHPYLVEIGVVDEVGPVDEPLVAGALRVPIRVRDGEARRIRVVSSELYSDRYDLPEGIERWQI